MELDKTRIAVRERGMLEILDLSLQVTRVFFWPILLTLLIGVVPLMLINHLLIGWLSTDLVHDIDYPVAYLWNMVLLVYIEAQLATVFVTGYIGQAVFLQRPKVREVVKDVILLLPRISWCQLIVRAVLPVALLMLTIAPHGRMNDGMEYFLIPGILVYVLVLRGVRPYINEIIILERNPMKATRAVTMTVSKRSSLLHSPSTSELFVRYLLSAVVACLLALSLIGTFLALAGYFTHSWRQGDFFFSIVVPLSLWLVAGFFAVVRFLSYLDLRIRQEGWEVELQLRAEAAKLANKMV